MLEEPQHNGAIIVVVKEQIWESNQLLGRCLIGATLGTLVKLLWKPSDGVFDATGRPLIRMLSAKAITSISCGLIATPMALRYMEWTPDADLLVFLAGVVAFLGDLTIGPALNIYNRWIATKEQELTRDKDA